MFGCAFPAKWLRLSTVGRPEYSCLTLKSDPFTGAGQPERLEYLPGNTWSRRITHELRLVYRVDTNFIDFFLARFHY